MHILKSIEENSSIPRLIHQTFQTKNIPPEFEENVNRIKAMNPDWHHQIYDDEDILAFLTEYCDPGILNYYNRINPKYGAAKADLFRYLLLYKFGGVYLDIKSTINFPLDSILKSDDQYLLTQWKNKPGEKHEGWGMSPYLKNVPGGEFQQWHVVASPGHPFLKAVIEKVLSNIDHYNPWVHGTGGNGVLRVTGPIAYTEAIYPLMPYHKHRFATDAELGFDYTIFKNSSHKPLFKSHYTKHTEPVIKLRGIAGISASIYSFLKRTKRDLLKNK